MSSFCKLPPSSLQFSLAVQLPTGLVYFSSCRFPNSIWLSTKRQHRRNTLIRVTDFSDSLHPPRQVPPWCAVRRISHHLDQLLTFMQERRWLTPWQRQGTGYPVSDGRTGRRPCLTSKTVVLHNASTKLQALSALYGFCTFQTAPCYGRCYRFKLSARLAASQVRPWFTTRSPERSNALALSIRGAHHCTRLRSHPVWHTLCGFPASPWLRLALKFQDDQGHRGICSPGPFRVRTSPTFPGDWHGIKQRDYAVCCGQTGLLRYLPLAPCKLHYEHTAPHDLPLARLPAQPV